MKLEYTTQELCVQAAALENLFDTVALVDPHARVRLDPATQQPLAACGPVPALDGRGRGVRRITRDGTELLAIFQAVQVDGRPLVLAMACTIPQSPASDLREANARVRTVSQCFDDLNRDFVTGVYNRRYLNETYMPYAAAQAAAGQPVSVVMARVNEYGRLCCEEGPAAADNCLNTAAGLLQLAAGTDSTQTALARLGDGLFAVAAVGRHAAALEAALRETLDTARREFSLSLSRRGEFTMALAAADWAETGSWEMMLSLAQQRLDSV